jgi:hypothetical protein
MKKQECKHFKNLPGQICQECLRDTEKSNDMISDLNLYAAEFLLYAFHFEHHTENSRQINAITVSPFLLLATEG